VWPTNPMTWSTWTISPTCTSILLWWQYRV
jgi:hypothetical protein